jgi:hypothetical protein
MKLPKTTLTTETVEFKNVPNVIKALQKPGTLTVDVREITTRTEHHTLLRYLNSLKPPFGICTVTPKGN